MALRRLDHFLVLTDDLEGTTCFYRDVLGFEVGERPPFPFTGKWLYLDGSPCLHLADRTSYEAHASTMALAVDSAPIDHVAFAADDYEALAARLEAAGVEATANVVPGALRQLFLTDPNGLRIELNVPEGGFP